MIALKINGQQGLKIVTIFFPLSSYNIEIPLETTTKFHSRKYRPVIRAFCIIIIASYLYYWFSVRENTLPLHYLIFDSAPAIPGILGSLAPPSYISAFRMLYNQKCASIIQLFLLEQISALISALITGQFSSAPSF
jgi:hypothetical protein